MLKAFIEIVKDFFIIILFMIEKVMVNKVEDLVSKNPLGFIFFDVSPVGI